MSTERGDGVDDRDEITYLAQAGEQLDRLAHSGGGLGVDHRDDDGARIAHRTAHALHVDRLAPGRFDADHPAAPAPDDLGHARAEKTVAAHDDLVPFVDETANARLHPGAS